MRLITLADVGFTYRKPSLLEDIQLAIDSGERIGLLGRNGMGKSTLMKIIAGEIRPDHGTVRVAPKIRIARLVQEVPTEKLGSIREVVLGGLDENRFGHHDHEEWRDEAMLHKTLSRMELDGERSFDSLSAGMKRRVLLARSIVSEPDLLLLDEPTNHLDIESILWLEDFLLSFSGSLLFVTHDRTFLQNLATRILEIDRGRLLDWECNYTTFLKRKADVLEAEEQQQALFDKRLAAEEVWIRQGIKARRTRNEGRVRALEEMRRERAARRSKVGEARMQVLSADRSGELVLQVDKVSFAYGDRPIIRDFTTQIMRGDRVGFVGPNGAGKSTLLKLLLGQLQPTQGTIRHGTKLEILYLDQLRAQIDDNKTIAENVGEGSDKIIVNGQSRHIFSYLQDFLFTPDRSRQLASTLSGGERNRLLLAKLFKFPSNLLVLDEPTNDLDAETMELLEEIVSNYQGTLLLVSHDRTFLNNVVTSIIAVDGSGDVKEYGGGYDDYYRAKQKESTKQDDQNSGPKLSSTKSIAPSTNSVATAKSTKPSVKLSFKEQRELAELPQMIDRLEKEQAELHEQMASPEFFKQSSEKITQVTQRLSHIQKEFSERFSRWEELEARSLGAS